MNVNILDFGAVGDGVTLCTDKIQAAIDACATTGGGRVSVAPGVYLVGTIWLRSNVELHLEHGATLKASTRMDDYNALDAYPQNFSVIESEKWVGKHLIIAHECENVALTGGGVIDGSGDFFFEDVPQPQSLYFWRDGGQSARDKEQLRPGQCACFIECRRVKVEDVSFVNQPCWACFLHGCEYASVRGIKVLNPQTYFNTDGIDIDCCRFVTVSDCIIDTGDDAIAIRGSQRRLKRPRPCEHVVISNCTLASSSSGIRIGVGNGLIRHIRISNITISRAAPAITVMSTYGGRGGVSIEDVAVSGVSATNLCQIVELIEEAGSPIRDIVLEGFNVETDGFFRMRSSCPDSVRGVTLRNWMIKMNEPPVPSTEHDKRWRPSAWCYAENIGELHVDGLAVADPHGYTEDPWDNGRFFFVNCDGQRLENIDIIGE